MSDLSDSAISHLPTPAVFWIDPECRVTRPVALTCRDICLAILASHGQDEGLRAAALRHLPGIWRVPRGLSHSDLWAYTEDRVSHGLTPAEYRQSEFWTAFYNTATTLYTILGDS